MYTYIMLYASFSTSQPIFDICMNFNAAVMEIRQKPVSDGIISKIERGYSCTKLNTNHINIRQNLQYIHTSKNLDTGNQYKHCKCYRICMHFVFSFACAITITYFRFHYLQLAPARYFVRVIYV